MQLAPRWSCFIDFSVQKKQNTFSQVPGDNLISSAKSVHEYFLVSARLTVSLG